MLGGACRPVVTLGASITRVNGPAGHAHGERRQSVDSGRLSDQITQTARAIMTNDHHG